MYKLNKLEFFLILIVLVLLFFYYPIIFFLPSISYIDEILFLISLLMLFKYRLKHKFQDCTYLEVSIFACLIMLIVIGIISNINSGIVKNNLAILIDLTGILKAPIIFIFFLNLCSDTKNSLLKILRPLSIGFVLIATVFGITNLIFDINMSYDIRYGLRSFTFIYNNPAALIERTLVCFAILNSNKKKNLFFNICIYLILILTIRGAALGVLAVIFFSSFVIKSEKMNLRSLTPILIGSILLGWQQIKEYFISNITPRSLMLMNSFKVSNSYFPLGAGFASYGSDMAYKNYSSLYYKFGYQYIWGLSPSFGSVVNDNFWPMIIGQFGYIGLCIYSIMLLFQILYILKLKIDKKNKRIAIILFSFLIISSIGNPIFTSVSGCFIYSFLGLLIQREMRE